MPYCSILYLIFIGELLERYYFHANIFFLRCFTSALALAAVAIKQVISGVAMMARHPRMGRRVASAGRVDIAFGRRHARRERLHASIKCPLAKAARIKQVIAGAALKMISLNVSHKLIAASMGSRSDMSMPQAISTISFTAAMPASTLSLSYWLKLTMTFSAYRRRSTSAACNGYNILV